jgi:hypothetical protein
MKPWIKTAAVFSVIMLLFFGYKLYSIKYKKYVPESTYTQPLQIPTPLTSKDVELSTLIENMPEKYNPFKKKFFEVIEFKGAILENSGKWVALFANPDGGLLKLAEGDSYDGVKVTYIGSSFCEVKFGNTERVFEVSWDDRSIKH